MSPSPEPIRQLLRKIGYWKWVGAALVVATATWGMVGKRPVNLPDAAFVPVIKGDFRVSIVEGGTLQAVNEEVVRCELEGTSRILSLVPEGTYVKKGDLLVEIDSSELRDNIVQQEIACKTVEESCHAAESDLLIQKSTVASAIEAARLKLEFAQSDLKKYKEGDWPQQRKVAESAITIADEEMSRAQDRLDWTVKLQEKGYATKTELEADSLSAKQKAIALDQAREVLNLLVKFDNPKAIRQLESIEASAKNEFEQTKQRSVAQVAQSDAKLDAARETFDLQKTKLERLREQLTLTKITAPQNGLVVYADGNISSGYLAEEGGLVRQRQELIKLPDVSKMMVKVWIHESQINLVKPGMTAYVTMDSLLHQQFKGKVGEISLLPDIQSRQGNQNYKVYATNVLIDDPLPNLKPGVSAQAEIVITERPQSLTVPIQAVTTVDGRTICHVRRGNDAEPVPVKVGYYNDQRVEIVGGLVENQEVLLAPPSGSGLSTLPEQSPVKTETVVREQKTNTQADRPQTTKPREAS